MAKTELPFRITMLQSAAEHMWEYTDLAKGEMSLVGIVDELKDSKGIVTELRVREVYLPIQENTSGTTEIDDDSLNAYLAELHKRGNDDLDKVRCWIHSHGDMGVFWSSTDTATIAKWSPDKDTEIRYLVSIVVNQKRYYKARLDIFTPPNEYCEAGTQCFDDLTVEFVDECDKDLFAEYYKEYLANTENIEPAPLFDEKQQRALDYATRICVERALETIERVSLYLLAGDTSTQSHIRKLVDSPTEMAQALRKCAANKKGYKHLLREHASSPEILIQDFLDDRLAAEEAIDAND